MKKYFIKPLKHILINYNVSKYNYIVDIINNYRGV